MVVVMVLVCNMTTACGTSVGRSWAQIFWTQLDTGIVSTALVMEECWRFPNKVAIVQYLFTITQVLYCTVFCSQYLLVLGGTEYLPSVGLYHQFLCPIVYLVGKYIINEHWLYFL